MGVSTSSVMVRICKLGSKYPDINTELEGMIENLQQHGYYKRANSTTYQYVIEKERVWEDLQD